jgi:hypothetical protein
VTDNDVIQGKRGAMIPTAALLYFGVLLLGVPALLTDGSLPLGSPGAWLLLSLALAGLLLTAWCFSYRVWLTSSHLLICRFGRWRAYRWSDLISVDYRSSHRAPSRQRLRAGFGASGETLEVVHEMFSNHDRLASGLVARALAHRPSAQVDAICLALWGESVPNGRFQAIPVDPGRYEPAAISRNEEHRLRLSLRAFVMAAAGAVGSLAGLLHGVHDLALLALGAATRPANWLLTVAELSLIPLIGLISAYVLASRFTVGPRGLTVRPWGLRTVHHRWDTLTPPATPSLLAVLRPGSGKGSAILQLLDPAAALVPLNCFANEGLLFESLWTRSNVTGKQLAESGGPQ